MKTELVKAMFLMIFTLMLSCGVETEKIIYVNSSQNSEGDGSSWREAFADLENAIKKAETGYEIWVAAGTYLPSAKVGGEDSRNKSFLLKNGVEIYGGFIGSETKIEERDWINNKTILSGDLNGDDDNGIYTDNSFHVVTGTEADPSAIIDGFYIISGNANADVWPDDGGGGMNNFNGSPTIRNCTFELNQAFADGGGVRNWGDKSKPTIINCTFIGNSASQEGGGMMNGPGSKPTVMNCRFLRNSAGEDGGGMYNNESFNSLIANCIFVSNSADLTGGGMYNVNESSPNVINCSFSKNNAKKFGGAVCNNNGFPTLVNCILWENTAPTDMEIHNIDPSVTKISFSIIQGGFVGEGNINEDPVFLDEDLRLAAESPGIDAGNNKTLPKEVKFDLDSKVRIVNSVVDLGPYEFQK
jgi:predicted outer membrane repeat protein